MDSTQQRSKLDFDAVELSIIQQMMCKGIKALANEVVDDEYYFDAGTYEPTFAVARRVLSRISEQQAQVWETETE